jgi:hypothetical protein
VPGRRSSVDDAPRSKSPLSQLVLKINPLVRKRKDKQTRELKRAPEKTAEKDSLSHNTYVLQIKNKK